MNDEKIEEIIKKLAKENNEDFNYTKLAEELNELAEICLKKVNKKMVEKQPQLKKFGLLPS